MFPATSTTRRHTESSGGWSYTHKQTRLSDSHHCCFHPQTPLETRGYKHLHIWQWIQARKTLDVALIFLSFCSFSFVSPLSWSFFSLSDHSIEMPGLKAGGVFSKYINSVCCQTKSHFTVADLPLCLASAHCLHLRLFWFLNLGWLLFLHCTESVLSPEKITQSGTLWMDNEHRPSICERG